jgi:hypothetical protein
LVILFIYEDLPNQLRHGKFAERFALPNPCRRATAHTVSPLS